MSAITERSIASGSSAQRPSYDFRNFNAKVREYGLKETLTLIQSHLDHKNVFEEVVNHPATKCTPKAVRISLQNGGDAGEEAFKTVVRWMINALVDAVESEIKPLTHRAPVSAWWAVYYKLDEAINGPQSKVSSIEVPAIQSMAPARSSRKNFDPDKKPETGPTRSARRRGSKSTAHGGRH